MKQKRCVMQGIEASVLWGDELNFEPHCHDEYVISTNVIGNERLILDGQAMTAREGATTLYNPGHVQGGSGTSVLVSLYLEPDFF
ncbi:MAG: AraC family ligand binding domain-containing protein, partial [Pseudomonadota bacterium]